MITPDLSRDQVEFLISQFCFSLRDREILKMRLLDGYTYEKIAEAFDLSVRQTRNIIHKNKENLFRHIDRIP